MDTTQIYGLVNEICVSGTCEQQVILSNKGRDDEDEKKDTGRNNSLLFDVCFFGGLWQKG